MCLFDRKNHKSLDDPRAIPIGRDLAPHGSPAHLASWGQGRLDRALRCMAKASGGVRPARRGDGVSRLADGHPARRAPRLVEGLVGLTTPGRSVERIAPALAPRGISAVRLGERRSSSRGPSCGLKDVVRHPHWRLRCKACGERSQSDQAGSRHILRQNTPSVRWAGLEASPRTATRRWNRHGREIRAAHPERGAMTGRSSSRPPPDGPANGSPRPEGRGRSGPECG